MEQSINNVFCVEFIKTYGGCVLHNDDTMTKIIDGLPVTKQCARRKDWSYDFIENINIEDIDTEYFNLDYSSK